MKLKKCPNCGAVMTIISERKHPTWRGIVRYKTCVPCGFKAKSYQPPGGEESYVPNERELTLCNGCKNPATHFVMVTQLRYSGTEVETELPMCDECHDLYKNPLRPKPIEQKLHVRVIYKSGFYGI